MVYNLLPMTPFTRIVKAQNVRMSKEGYSELRDIIKDRAVEISEHAARVSRHSGRKTVTKKDVEFVIGNVKK